MYRTITFRLPARRSALAAGAAALAAAAGALAVPAAQAAPDAAYGGGTSTAAVLRASLDVSLLGGTADVPVDTSLDDVRAPADASETALTVTVGRGVQGGRPVSLLRAKAATAEATADTRQARGHAELADVQVHVPGLPLLALVRADVLTATATCRAGHHPTASSTLAGVTVLGRRVALHADGPTDVQVPGVGRVRLDLTRTATTSTTAAATALHLGVRLDPARLGVAKVSGDVTLVQATCRTPRAGGSTGGVTNGSTSGSTSGSTVGSTAGSTAGPTSGGSTSGSASGGSASGGSGSGGASTSGASGGGSSTGATASGGTGTAGTGTSGAGTTGAGTTGTGSTGTPASAGTTATGGDGYATGGDLAHTGASGALPYLVPAAAGLMAAGAGAIALSGRRRRARAASRPEA
ncbi:SCO1860 family LAETG-anchored protein [Streptomyces sp. HPF1205]|uniref:SCO1860 family LAETG-anchored protein n=1 Tax=Streptomyces sp. HPF1205 TaxID=2873262 RepID=UPI001CEDA187|nr:SCO1860 family LAETG-anchored protein [Streptomyces sp. HPF1205]